MTKFNIGDTVIYRGAWGTADPVETEITAIGEKNGRVVYDNDIPLWGYEDAYTAIPVLISGQPVRYDLCPNHADGIERYIEHRIPFGGFLTAVFENDLMGAVEAADTSNRQLLADYAVWLFNHAPTGCYGSPEKVKAWLKNEG